jgi:surface protein
MPAAGDTQVPANSDIRWDPVPNATGYRVTVTRDDGSGPVEVYNQTLAANTVGVDFTNEFTPGDDVSVLVIPFNDEGDAVGCSPISFTVVESWVNSPAAFKLTYDTALTDYKSTPANQLRIEANTGYPGYLVYDYSIDWGDGQYNNHVTSTITHTYLTPGIYTVSIIGNFPAPYHYYSNSDSIKLISIDQWGTQPWESMELAFYGCQNMEYNATDVPDLSNVASMRNMFGSCSLFNGNIENWDVSNVTDMYGVFLGATDFNQPLNNWDVRNVTNMSAMFLVASAFDQPLNNWDVSNVTNMADMFRQASVFNQNIDNWNVSNVTDMSQMFERAELFNQPLNSWNVGNVTDMSQMFDGFVYDMAFNQPLDNWDVRNVTTMQAMFRRSTAFNQNINSWNVSNVLDMSYMFRDTDNFDQPLNNWDVNSVVNMQYMFYDAKVFDQNINSWNVTNVTNMRSMFQLAGAFDQPLGNWDVNSVVNMQSMFQSASVFNQPLDS